MCKKIKTKILILLFCFFCLILTACGNSGSLGSFVNSNNKVPDQYINTYIEKMCYEECEEYSRMNISSMHNYDSASHIDTVLVTLTETGYYGSRSRQLELKYQYDKSSDLWSLFAASEWPDEYVFAFNDNIIGENDFYFDQNNFDGVIHLNILSADSTNITIDSYAHGICTGEYPSAWTGEYDEYELYIEGSGTYEIYDNWHGYAYANIFLNLPDGWHSTDGESGYHEYVTYRVEIDIDDGVNIYFYQWIHPTNE